MLFCIVPLPFLVLRLHTACNGLFSALPLLFTNFHCCESDLELKNGFTLTRLRRHSFALRGRTEVRRWPGPLPPGRGTRRWSVPREAAAGGCSLLPPPRGSGEAGGSGRWGRAGPATGVGRATGAAAPALPARGGRGLGAWPRCHWSSPRKGRNAHRRIARGLACGREGGGVPIGLRRGKGRGDIYPRGGVRR